MKKIILILVLVFMAGCSGEEPGDQAMEKYERTFFDSFDTVISYVAYAESEENFKADADFVEAEFLRLHKIYDKYKTYEGLNNLKTINDMAGRGPVEVDRDLIELLLYARDLQEKISPKVNIGLGSVLQIWHDYREAGLANPDQAQVPPMADLDRAKDHTSMENLIIDEENSRVEILDPHMSLDLGAIAKGYAVELVGEASKARGVENAIISAGGNVKTLGRPLDGRETWGIGIQNPDNAMARSEDRLIEVLYVGETSVVTSGNYQRYYEVGGKLYNHIIDPDGLMPGDYYKGVSVMVEDSGLADFLSTAAFLLPLDEGKKIIEDNGAEALWIMPDNSLEYTEGMAEVMGSMKE